MGDPLDVYEATHPELVAAARALQAATERFEREETRRNNLIEQHRRTLGFPDGTVYVVFCWDCDPDTTNPLLFDTPAARGRLGC